MELVVELLLLMSLQELAFVLDLVRFVEKSSRAEGLPPGKKLCHLVVVHIEVRTLNCSLNLIRRRQSHDTHKVMFLLSGFNESDVLPLAQVCIVDHNTLSAFLNFLLKFLIYLIVYALKRALIS